MPDEVGYGRERRPLPRPSGRALAIGVAVALVAGGVAYGVTRPRHRRQPVAQPTATETPAEIPTDEPTDEPTGEPPPDPFGGPNTVVAAPVGGAARGVLLAGDEPGFVVRGDDDKVRAFGAVAYLAPAPVVVAWCAPSRTFEDPTGRVVFDANGRSYGDPAYLTEYAVRPAARGLEVGSVGSQGGPDAYAAGPPQPHACPVRRTPAPLPRPARAVGRSYRVLHGLLRLSHVETAFCPSSGAPCDLGETLLPPADLVGRYELSGDFLVSHDGALAVARLPGSRVVRRREVGVTLRIGFVRVVEEVHGQLMVRFDPCRYFTGTPDDNSPGGPPGDVGDYAGLLTDPNDGVREYPVRSDVLVLVTTLDDFAHQEPDARVLRRLPGLRTPLAFWLVLDGRGGVLRLIDQGGP